jgi:hypothetical protein
MCQNGENDSQGSSLYWTWASWRLSAENSSVPVKIPVNPHRVGFEGHGDHQLRVALKISKKKCQNGEKDS